MRMGATRSGFRQQAGIGGLHMKSIRLMVAAFAAFLSLGSAHAALNPFQVFTGTLGLSSDGWGSTTQTGTISANVPLGATVTAAYLYTSTFNNGALTGVGGMIAGSPIGALTSLGTNPPGMLPTDCRPRGRDRHTQADYRWRPGRAVQLYRHRNQQLAGRLWPGGRLLAAVAGRSRRSASSTDGL